MALKTAPVAAGARIAYMPDGSSLVPAIVIAVWQGSVGVWLGDIRTQDGLLENRSLHPDYFIKQQHLQEVNRTAWADIWDALAKENA